MVYIAFTSRSSSPHHTEPPMDLFRVTILALAWAQASAAQAAQGGDFEDPDYYNDELSSNNVQYGLRLSGATALTTGDNTFSYVVQIRPSRTTLSTVQPPSCAGILITGADAAGAATQYVVTSARCALSGDLLFVTAGGIRNVTAGATATTTVAVAASSVIVHEEFLRNMQTADLAVFPVGIALTAATATAAATITAARLPPINRLTRWYLKRDVTMAGWGYPSNVYTQNTVTMQQVRSFTLFNWYCRLRHLGLTIASTHICTSGLPNKGPCTGDSGAPLVLRSGNDAGTVIGLATYVPNNGCSRGSPGVFTRLTSYLSWIQTNTGYVPSET